MSMFDKVKYKGIELKPEHVTVEFYNHETQSTIKMSLHEYISKQFRDGYEHGLTVSSYNNTILNLPSAI